MANSSINKFHQTLVEMPLRTTTPKQMAMDHDLHIFFLPFLAPGHMIPMVDLAKLFAARTGVKATIITTASNVPLVEPAIARSPRPIGLLTLPYPSSIADNVAKLPTPDLPPDFIDAIDTLKDPLDHLIAEHKPDCIVSDIFYPWTADLASDHGIPRLAFHGTCAFTVVVMKKISTLKPHDDDDDESRPFIVPDIPHRIEMVKSQFPRSIAQQDDVIVRIIKAQAMTYGTIMNTFTELEAGYAEELEGRSWLVGPVSLCNRDTTECAVRGGEERRNFDACMNWLDDVKRPGSVVYVCFGSLGQFTRAQLREIATGLGNAGHPFVWVVRTPGETGEWMPEGFEFDGKGLIVKGWAPQVAILSHPAVGGFVTHCGWNSCLEGVAAGVPMVTWPQFAEQFLNERLVVDVLGTGVSVGAKVCSGTEEKRTLVEAEAVRVAVSEVMGDGEEAEGRRRRAREFAAMAVTAMEEAGSSYRGLSRLIEELRVRDVKQGRGAGLGSG